MVLMMVNTDGVPSNSPVRLTSLVDDEGNDNFISLAMGSLTLFGENMVSKVKSNATSLEISSNTIRFTDSDDNEVLSADTTNLHIRTNCSVVSEKQVLQSYSVATYTSDTSTLYTPADILGGIIYRSTTDINIVDQVPSVEDMYNYAIQQCGEVYVGTGIKFTIINSGENSFILMGNVGIEEVSNNFIDIHTGQTYIYLFKGPDIAELHNLSFFEPL